MYAYTLVRSRRKTLAIHITRDAAVEVRAPMKMSGSYIAQFVASKERWIASHLARREAQNEEKAAFTLHYGDTVLLRGQRFPISARDEDRLGFDGLSFFMPPGLTAESIKFAVVQIYRLAAKSYITKRTDEYAGRMGLAPAAVHVTGAKTRWGSCSSKNSLNFSWRLMMAEDEVIDYVVVHELAHIRELNHSPRFWGHVAKVLPDYETRKTKLKHLQEKLALEDWD